ncbi:bifunctional DNA primase/polymerase [Streptomyces sp. JJ36]|uniref:bifunctional DNA primase/polymerase n=1 Tax=Streptomyces sp. JJ36 TaxID=2736645 RepID=UPI001F46B5DF|nr:bifunctional DNA primase/polymerase [Streptomyces sp. JJ36]MCF6526005.1 hypothetical protein [Streptomyces sp. JJ36]
MSIPPDTAPAAAVTPAGADWLASASRFPRSVHALWELRPAAPSVLPCGTAFDVVSAAPVPGRRVLERLWASGPGSGPVAVHRDRLLLFAAPGTADRLPALLDWQEWRGPRAGRPGACAARAETIPPLLCHGGGEAVTVPPLRPDPAVARLSRWLVAPDVRHPRLPGADSLLWACVRAFREPPPGGGRSAAGRGGGGHGKSNFAFAGSPAKVYHVSRRR